MTPKTKRNLNRLIPFAIIWLVTGWVFLYVEMSISGFKNLNPDSDITLTFPVLLYASIAVLAVGLIVGAIELFLLDKLFQNVGLGRKVVYKFITYLFFIIIVLVVNFPLATSIETGLPLFSEEVWNKFIRFITGATIFSTLLQLCFSLILSLLYAAISENIGHNVLINFFTGKYHTPKLENRIFMFLDMKSSTTIAEKLSNTQYFDLLKDFYDSMSDAIINNYGDVYQYIGDEVVITWKAEEGIKNAACIQCYFDLKKALDKKQKHFLDKYGENPEFKAGMHIGEVTTGEIGALKKEIFFTGDVLNTTSRIQSLCSKYQTDLLISNELYSRLPEQPLMRFQELGNVQLKGKEQSIGLFSMHEF